MRRLQENFRPEFLNRIDEVIIFRRLEAEQLRQITELLLEETRRRLHAQDIEVEFTAAGVDWLAEHGYQPEFGARPLRRMIQREVDNRLSRMLLEHGALARGRRSPSTPATARSPSTWPPVTGGTPPASTSHPR